MPPRPGTALEVVQAEAVFELPVVVLGRRLGRSTPASARRGVSAKVMNKTNVNEELVNLS
jgi:hypothetical protein